MTLESEGFLHFSYAGSGSRCGPSDSGANREAPVVLLIVDPDLLDVPVVAENTSGGTELFPHVYGPLPVAAVVRVTPIEVDPDGDLVVPDLTA